MCGKTLIISSFVCACVCNAVCVGKQIRGKRAKGDSSLVMCDTEVPHATLLNHECVEYRGSV